MTHQGQLLHEFEITQDAQVHVKAVNAAQYVWGATNDRPGGANNDVIALDSAVAPPSSAQWGEKVTDGLLGSPIIEWRRRAPTVSIADGRPACLIPAAI